MKKTPALRMFLSGFMLLLGTQAFAQTPSPASMLDPQLAPKFEDVVLSVPTPDELSKCTVKLVQGATAKSNGWLLLDPKGQPLRRFFDSTGSTKVDMWSYYKDGIEVYREFDTAGKGKPNHFRWLNSGGMKWGIGAYDAAAKQWKITSWRMISAEEVSFEAFQAVAMKDYARLEALFITDADMQSLKLPASKVQAISAAQKQAADKFAAIAKNPKLAGAKFDSVEGATPHCDTAHGDVDVIKHPTRAVRYLASDKLSWIHTGEMIQVGMAWRLVDVPSLDINPQQIEKQPGELEKLLNLLAKLDEAPPPSAGLVAKNKAVEAYYRKRIDLVTKILPLDKEAEREGWYRQIFDNMTALAQNNGDDATFAALVQMKDAVVNDKKFPTNLAAYGTYRVMWTAYAIGVAKEGDKQEPIRKLTTKWLDDLTEFTKTYSKADDTPDALWQLAMGCEFDGKTEQAKRGYKELATNFPDHYHAPRARGALARLELVKNEMILNAPLLADSSKTFNITQLKGKIVIVHYWATASSSHVGDFAVLKQIAEKYGAKNNVEIVCISLDDEAARAKEAVARAQVPGVHLFQATNNAAGLNSPLAIQYGIHILPTTFLVGRDGRVMQNALQPADIVTELKKVLE